MSRSTVRRWTVPADVTRRARLFILHGTHEHSGRYNELACFCGRAGIEAVSFDFHGHGERRDGERGDFGRLDDAIREAVELVLCETAGQPPLPYILFGHSLGSMVAFLAAHELATTAEWPSPALVVLHGFAMDSVSPPFGIHALIPVLRAMPQVIRRIALVMAAVAPQGPACPLPPPHALTHDAERAQRALSDPLVYHGWIQNRTAIALLDARARCKALLSKWGDGAFPFLLVHGGYDTLCPRSACDALLAAAPQHDKELKVYDGLLHEVIHERSPDRERALADIVAWLRVRLVAAAPLPSKL